MCSFRGWEFEARQDQIASFWAWCINPKLEQNVRRTDTSSVACCFRYDLLIFFIYLIHKI
ncbi:hypothetical protein BC826DRAFT_998485 [Russula brevipes]|nr:hypothetical protein BC826DRAFT_998485 [Russula brevipes]